MERLGGAWRKLGLLFIVALVCGMVATAALAQGEAAAPEESAGGGDALTWALWLLAPLGAIAALVFARIFYKDMMKFSEGTERMAEIAQHVREGAMAYLWQQYKVVGIFFVFAVAVLCLLAFVAGTQHPVVPFGFLTAGFFSALSGYIGMRTATAASARTAAAARESLDQGLRVAFRSGAVMGLVVVGLGLLDISLWFIALYLVDALTGVSIPLSVIAVILLARTMGASAQALFARVGGGIYTKAADVGADLVGKVEAGIPEDDPRNPATIADNVGDNVGDVAGMGADLYESYCGSILATGVLGVAAGLGLVGIALPMAIAGIGILASIAGVFMVKTREDATQHDLLKSLARGVNVSGAAIVVAALLLCLALLSGLAGDGIAGLKWWGPFLSTVTGLLAGVIIGKATEYSTSHEFKPTRGIAEQGGTGPATVIIEGLAVGMKSTWIPVLAVGFGTLLAFGFSGGFVNPTLGLFGVGIAAVGMLSTLGITLATDAYGPIADNAGGNAEMAELEPFVRERTDALDALGNTTAATGKGFAIGSAALTALALLAAYIEEVRMGLIRIAQASVDGVAMLAGRPFTVEQLGQEELNVVQLVNHYDVHLMNPAVLVGMLLGAMMALLFCSFTMKAVGRAAGAMVQEVRRQFRTIPGIMDGTGTPDYAACVQISTKGAQREMILPSLVTLITPVLVGLVLGVPGVMGLLAGALVTGFVVAVMMANTGGAWDNAKKFIESGDMREEMIAPSEMVEAAKQRGQEATSNVRQATESLESAKAALDAARKEGGDASKTHAAEQAVADAGAKLHEAKKEALLWIDEEGRLVVTDKGQEEELLDHVRAARAGEEEADTAPVTVVRAKGSDHHKAGVVGDTVGDPFKDTSGPSLNILIKLMAMVAVVFAGFTVKYGGRILEMLAEL